MTEKGENLQALLNRSKEALRSSEKRFQKIIEKNADGILIVDSKAIIRFANPAAENLLGRDRDTLEGTLLGFPILSGETTEIDLHRTDLKRVVVEMRTVEITWEGEAVNLISLRDITDRKEAAEHIAHLNAVLRAIRNVNQVIARTHDRDALIQAVCDEMVKTHGYYHAWIALFEEPHSRQALKNAHQHLDKELPKIISTAEAGQQGESLQMSSRECQQRLMSCCGKALIQATGVSTVKDPASMCPDCPLAEHYGDSGALVQCLEYNQQIFGVITASTPKDFLVDPEERALFEEVAVDIALALHDLRLETLQQETEEELWLKDAAIATSINAIAMFDLEGKLTYVNDTFLDLWGYEDQEELLTRQPGEFWDDPDAVKEILTALREVGNWRGELVARRKDDTPFQVQISVNQVTREADGQPIALMASLIDITQRKQAEEELRRSAHMNEMLLDSLPHPAMLVSKERRVLAANRTAEELGTKVGDYCWRSFGQCAFIPEADRRYVQEHNGEPPPGGSACTFCELDRMWATGKAQRTAKLEMFDRTWDAWWIPIDHETYLHYTIDITERQEMERALRESEERFRSVIEQSQEGIVLVSNEGRILVWNQSLEEITGLRQTETVGQFMWDVQYQLAPEAFKAQPGSIESLRKRILEFLRLEHKEGTRTLNERDIVRPDGTRRTVQSSLFPIKIMDGYLLGSILRDITERKEMEQALRDSEQKLDQMLQTMADGMVVVDTQGAFIYANPAAEQILHVHRDEILERYYYEHTWQQIDEAGDLYPLDALPLTIAMREKRTVKNLEHGVVAPNGEIKWLSISAAPLINGTGEVYGAIANFRDVTEHREIETALRNSEQRYRTLFEHAGDAIFVLDLEGHYLDINPAACQQLDFSYEELLQMSPADVAVSMDTTDLQKYITLLSQQQHLIFEGEHRRRDGTTFPVEINSRYIEYDGQPAILSTSRDITERKAFEEALKNSEQRYRTLFEHSGDAIFVHDMEGRFLDVNQTACEMLGYSRDKLLEMTPQDVAVPEDAQLFSEHMQQLTQDQQIVFEAQHLRQDGTTVPVEVSSRHIEYDGQPAILSTARDITERQEAARQIEQYADDLARSNKELEQFAYVVSHDLQEPARMVSSYLDLIARRYRGEIDEKADGYIHYAVDGAERMQEMIRALLNLSRVETRGKAFAPTDVETIVERTLTILDRVIEESGAKITYTDLPTVQADRTQLAQVFQNLIANAIKFRREDVAPHVHVSARREDGAWCFAISDNGIGIDPGQADRIFQIFQRLHTREEYPGTGIGLALARKIVERHGGRLWMESVPGEGSTFYFTLTDSVV